MHAERVRIFPRKSFLSQEQLTQTTCNSVQRRARTPYRLSDSLPLPGTNYLAQLQRKRAINRCVVLEKRAQVGTKSQLGTRGGSRVWGVRVQCHLTYPETDCPLRSRDPRTQWCFTVPKLQETLGKHQQLYSLMNFTLWLNGSGTNTRFAHGSGNAIRL